MILYKLWINFREYFVRLLFCLRLSQKTQNSNNWLLCTLFRTNTACLKISARFWSKKLIKVNLLLRAMFCTIFSFLTQATNFKPNDTCAKCFDTNFQQLDSCAQRFARVLGLKQYGLRVTHIRDIRHVQEAVRNCPLAQNWRHNILGKCRLA